MITISEIENYRLRHHLTKKELAAAMGITYPFLVDILNGKRELSAATAAKFEVLRAEKSAVTSYDAVRAFAIRLTEQEYRELCAMVGAQNLTAEEAEDAVRRLLQNTWDKLAAEVPDVVEEPAYGEAMDPYA